METKIIKIVTGEELICKLGQILDKDNNQIGFKLIFPYKVVMRPIQSDSDVKYDINYVSWMGASSDGQFDISLSSVISMGNPVPEVAKLYQERYEEYVAMVESVNDESVL